MRVLEPNTVTILTTNKCTAVCRHCATNSGPNRNDMLTWDKMEPILRQLFAETKLSVIVFSGGESTLLGEDLLKALRLCKEHGIITRLVTNVFWATSPEAAEAKLKELREAGLNELNISTDDYHLPYISLQKVRYAFDAARKIDFLSVALCNAYGPESWLTPERINQEFGNGEQMKHRYDANGRAMVHERKQGETLVLLSNGLSMKLGRGKEGLEESEVVPTQLSQLYEFADTIGGCPWALRSSAVSSKGHYVSCCGFEVEDNPILDYGDLAKQPLSELLERADNDLISNMISIYGPVTLMKILKDVAPNEVSFPRPTYRGYCEVCEDLVSIKQNRDALYKYQGMFVDSILAVREGFREAYTKDGRVQIPPGASLRLEIKYNKVGEPPQAQKPLTVEEVHSASKLAPVKARSEEPPKDSPPPTQAMGKRSLPVLQPGSRCE